MDEPAVVLLLSVEDALVPLVVEPLVVALVCDPPSATVVDVPPLVLLDVVSVVEVCVAPELVVLSVLVVVSAILYHLILIICKFFRM